MYSCTWSSKGSIRVLLRFLVLTLTMMHAEYNKPTPDRTANTYSGTLLKLDMIILCPKNLISNTFFFGDNTIIISLVL